MARFALGGSAVRSYGSVLYALVLSRMRAGRRQALMISVLLLTLPLLIVSGLSYNRAQAAINEQLNFQARLLTTQGNTPTDGDYHVRFRIYCGGDGALAGAGSGADCNHATDEDLLWTETWTTGNLVEVKNGYLSVRLGSITAFGSAIDWNEEELYLSIEIGGNSGTASWDGEMDPFMRLTSTPYAFNAGALDGLDSTDFVQIGQGEQGVNSASTLISIDQAGAGDLIDLQVSNSSVFNLANDGDLTVTGSGTFVGLNAGTGLVQGTGGLTIGGTITFSSLNCTGNANGGALTANASGVVSCSDDDGGGSGSVDDLDDAYNNFGANPAVVTIDAAESQTGGLEFALNVTDNFTIDLQNTGDFVIQDNNTTFFTISDDGSFDYTLDVTDNPTFTVTNNGTGNVTYNLAGSGDFVIQDNGTPVFTVSDDGNATFANDLTVSGNLQLGFTQGSVVFQGASGLAQDNANLFWDDTNNKLGIGTATPHADAFGGLELVISEASAGTTAGISIQSGASLETQAIIRTNDSNGFTEIATLGSGNALLLYTNAATRAIFPSTGGFVVGGTLTDASFGTIEARGSTSASLAVNPRTAGGTGDLVFYEADTAQTGFRYDGTTNTTYFRDFANSANRITLTQAGDLYVSANGGTTGSPRTMAFNNLSSGEAVRFQFGDAFSAFQNQFGGSLDIYAYHTIRLAGDRNSGTALAFSTESNIGTHVINTVAASEALVVSGAASQSADLFVVENSAGTNLFEINSDGTFTFNTSVYDCSGNSNGGVLTVNASGNVICADDDGGVGSGGVDSLNTLNGALTLQGTTAQITVTDNGTDTITLSLPTTVTLGDTTNAGILELNDSSANAYKTILQSADLTGFAGNLTLTLPATDGDSNQCLKTDGSGVLSFSNCNNGSGGGGAITLQDAYEAGNFITTDDGGTYGDIQFTLADTATDRNFTVTTATGAAGYTYLSRADGAGTVDPAQLLLVEDLDTNRTIADGIRIQAAFGITDGLDVSDAELTNAINIGANAIAGTNFSVTGAGAITSVGLNAGTGLIQGTGGLTVSGTITFSSLTNCDTIDTDGSGVLSCGTDASGGGGLFTDGGTFAYLTATTDDLVVGASTSQPAKLAVVGDADETQLLVKANATQTGNIFVVENSGSTTQYLTVSAATTTVDNNLVVAASNTLRLVGDTTVNRPAGSPGELYYDTDTDTLLTYNGTKWVADRGEYIIVASGHGSDPSTQAERDSADYVTDGTADQTEINNALTAAAGGKVLLLGGTYVIDGSISIPNNTTLAGVGPGTNIEVDDIDVAIDAIVNSDTSTGTGVVIRDLTLNGRDDLNTAGTQRGIYFNNLGDNSGSSATIGGRVTNVTVQNLRTYGMLISSSNNNQVTNSTFLDNNTAIFINSSSTNNTFNGNLIQGNSGSGIYFAGGTNSTVSSNTIEGNSFGVRLDGATGITITGNTLTGNTSNAVFIDNGSLNSTVSGNTTANSGGSTNNNAIEIDASDNNLITGNNITDSSCTTNCYAIYIVNSTSDNNYLEGNRFSGSTTDAATINDAGTGTIYVNQQTNSTTSTNSDVSDFRFRGSANSATAFSIQNASGVNVLNIDSTNGQLEVGDYNGGTNPINGVIVFNNSTNANTVTVQSGATSTGYTLTLPTALGNSGDCLVDTNGSGVLGFTSCGGGSGAFASSGGYTTLNTTTDNVIIGPSATSTAKLFIDGDTDEVQFRIEANATQTANILEVNTNGGSGGDLLRLNGSGNLYVGGDISIDETDQLILDAGTGSNSYIQQSDNGIEFISDGVQVFKARNTGRVGIGTFNPQGRLEVDVADTANVPALILDMNDVTNNPDVLVIENAGTGNSIEIDTTDFIVDSTGNVQAAGNINANGGSFQTNGVARLDNSGNLVNIGNLTASGAITISATGAGNDLTLSSPDQIVLSGFNCSTFTNGGALTTDASGNITCSNDDGGGSAINLDDAYNNFGATASKINVDSAESQTGGLEFELTGTNDFIVDIQGTGSFQVQDAGGATPAFYVNSDGETALNSTTTNALLHINGNGTYSAQQSLVRLGGALDNAGGTLSVFEIGTDIDTGNLQSGYGLDISQLVVLDSGETTSSYRGIYVRAPSTSGTGSLTDSYGIYIADYDSVGGTGLNQSLRVDGQSRFSKAIGIGGSPSSGNMVTIDTDPGDNRVGLRILQQDTTNNPTALQVTNGGTGDSLEVENSTGNTFVVTHDGIVVLGGNNIINSELRIYDGDATANYVGLKSRAALAGNYTLTLPSTAPGVNECLKAGGTTATDLVFGSCGAGGSSLFTDGGTFAYLTATTDDLVLGASTDQSAKLAVVGDSDEVQFKIQANATQTSDLVQFTALSGGDFRINGSGDVIISSNTSSGSLQVEQLNSSGNALEIYRQTVQVAYFDYNGYLTLHPVADGKVLTINNDANAEILSVTTGATAANSSFYVNAGSIALNGTINAGGGNFVFNSGQDDVDFVVYGFNAEALYVDGTTDRVGLGTPTPGATLDVNIASDGDVGLIVQGTTSQTADMVQILNSTGTELLEIQDDGSTKFQVDTDSQTAFQVQDAGGQAYLTVDTESTTDALSVKIGAGTDNVLLVLDSIPAASEPTGIAGAMYYDSTNNRFRCYTTSWVNCDTTGGGGGIAVTLTRIPEYAGGTLYADGTNNSGTITAGYVSGLSAGQGYKHNYYEWTSGQGSQQDYDIVVHVQLPSDYQSMGAASTFSFWHWDDDGTGTDAEIDWALYDVDETQCFSTTDINASAADTWEQESASSLGSCSFAADDIITFRFKLKTNSTGGSIRLGEFQFEYNN